MFPVISIEGNTTLGNKYNLLFLAFGLEHFTSSFMDDDPLWILWEVSEEADVPSAQKYKPWVFSKFLIIGLITFSGILIVFFFMTDFETFTGLWLKKQTG